MKYNINVLFKILVICCNLVSFSNGQRPLSVNASLAAATVRPSLRGAGRSNGGINGLLSGASGSGQDNPNAYRNNSNYLDSLSGVAIDNPHKHQPTRRKNNFSILRDNLKNHNRNETTRNIIQRDQPDVKNDSKNYGDNVSINILYLK